MKGLRRNRNPVTIRQPAYRAAPGAPLAVLLKNVVDARAVLAQERQRAGATRGAGDPARAQVLSALKAYTAALEVRGLPVPYALRDELRIQQRVCR